MPHDTSISILSNSPRSRRAAIQIQAIARGYICRKRFHADQSNEVLEELQETEEWERIGLMHWETEEGAALVDYAHRLAALQQLHERSRAFGYPPPRPSSFHGYLNEEEYWSYSRPATEQTIEPNSRLKGIVHHFCARVEHSLLGGLCADGLQEFLPPGWNSQWWDADADDGQFAAQLNNLGDSIEFMVAKLKELARGILRLDPALTISVWATRWDGLRKDEDRIQERSGHIEDQISEAIGKTNRTEPCTATRQQLQEFQRHLKRERDCIEEGAYLNGMMELPAILSHDTKFQRQQRLNNSAASNLRPMTADTDTSDESFGVSDQQLSIIGMLERFHRWKATVAERTCDRWEAMLHRRETNLADISALLMEVRNASPNPLSGAVLTGSPTSCPSSKWPSDPKKMSRDAPDRLRRNSRLKETQGPAADYGYPPPSSIFHSSFAQKAGMSTPLGSFAHQRVLGWDEPVNNSYEPSPHFNSHDSQYLPNPRSSRPLLSHDLPWDEYANSHLQDPAVTSPTALLRLYYPPLAFDVGV